MTSAADRFTAACWRICEESKAIGYYPRYFARMLTELGGVETARRLIRDPKIQAGLAEVVWQGREDLSVEYLMLQPEFAHLFTEEERQKARRRLERVRKEVGRTKPKPPPTNR